MKAMVLEKPGQPLVLVERPDPLPGPGQIRLPDMRSLALSMPLERASIRHAQDGVWGFRGLGILAAPVTIVAPALKTCAMPRFLPATRAMAGSPPMSSQMPILLSISMRPPILWLSRPCSALG